MEAELLRRSTSAAVTHDRDAVRERCRTLAGFVREAWHVILPATPYLENWHIEAKCAHLEAVTNGTLIGAGYENRCLFNEPPGTMKSLLLCVFWLAWEWGPRGLPSIEVISTSYKVGGVLRDARRFRQLVTSDWYQSLWPIEITSHAEDRIENDKGGKRKAVPFGSLTNDRADHLLIDDPHSVDTAESDADRDAAEIRFRESATTRMNDPITSAIIVNMQRLHQKDISGIILSSRMPYVHLLFPMRFDPVRCCYSPVPNETPPRQMRYLMSRQIWVPEHWTPRADEEKAWEAEFATSRSQTVYRWDRRTKPGELLFATRFPRAIVDRDEAVMGAHATAGQHDQRPTPRGGLKFKRHNFKIVKSAPGDCRRVRGYDFAASDDRNAAYTSGVKVAYHAPTRHFYVEHVLRVRTENVEPVLVNTATQDGTDVEISIPQDPGQAGKVQARQFIAALIGYVATASPESGDKLSRAEPVIAQSEAGNISLVEGDWNETFLDEIETFPSGAFKDQVDAMSRAFAKFIMSTAEVVMPPIIMEGKKQIFGDNLE
jgi:predicted phage terminase large subunit-like protein